LNKSSSSIGVYEVASEDGPEASANFFPYILSDPDLFSCSQMKSGVCRTLLLANLRNVAGVSSVYSLAVFHQGNLWITQNMIEYFL
jgi:hypothetical protein